MDTKLPVNFRDDEEACQYNVLFIYFILKNTLLWKIQLFWSKSYATPLT